MKFQTRIIQVFVSLLTLVMVAPANAQSVLEEVIVTAQKREQSVEDVGITINSFSSEDIQNLGLRTVTDVALVTPGVGQAGSFAGQSLTFAIRGVTQQDFAFHVEPPVAIYIDEGYFAANNAYGVGLFDLERVEVLKGPQGTLFGRNATGGLVSVSSRKPTEEVEGFIDVGYASYNNPRVEAAVGGPISDKVQARIAGIYESRDGWLENLSPTGDDLGGHDTYGIRGHLQFQPNEAINILLTGSYNDVDQSWGPYTTFPSVSTLDANGIPNNVDTGAADVAPGFVSAPRSNIDDLEINANQGRDDGGYFRVGSGTARIDADLGWAELTSVTDYKDTEIKLLLDNDAGPNNTITSIAKAKIETFSQELRLFKEFDRARLTTGFYYLNLDAREQESFQILYSLGGVATNAPTQVETDSYSLFGQYEYDLNEQWTLIAGMRATREEKDYIYRADVHALNGSTNDAEADIGPVLLTARSFEDSNDDWLWTWKLQAEYRPNDDMMFYVGYNRGTKAGSWNAPFAGGATPADPDVPYGEERLDSYEGGAKLTLMDNRAQLNASVFYYDYDDFQSFTFVNFATVTTNVEADAVGAEVDLHIVPTEALDLRFGAAYTDFTVKDAVLSNLALVLSGTPSVTADREPPFTSKFTAFAIARYTVPLAGGALTLQGDIKYNDGFNYSVTNFEQSDSGDFTHLGMRVSWLSPSEEWEVAFWGKNLTDERHKTVGFDGADALGWTETGYNLPRWFGGSVSYRF